MSGIGRGRGWLNLNTLDQKKPTADKMEKMPLNNVPSDVKKIIETIFQFSDNDDGILINQKFKYVNELFTKFCQTGEDVRNTFNIVYNYALTDEHFGYKFIKYGTLKTFENLTIHDVSLRKLFLNRLQSTYEEVKDSNDVNTINNLLVLMIGYPTTSSHHIILPPTVIVLSGLLRIATKESIEYLVKHLIMWQFVQLPLHPEYHESRRKEALDELKFNVRVTLATENLCEQSKYYLLFAIDYINCQFQMPADLMQFYLEKIEKKQIINKEFLQEEKHNSDLNSFNGLNLIDEAPKFEEKQQQQTPPKAASVNPNASGPRKRSPKGGQQQQQGVKNGRPILGAGMRDNANKKQNDAPLGPRGSHHQGDKKKERRRHNGEHDDRFETEYDF